MELFSDTTLYYYFSTIAQVVAATVALISIALQFKVNNLKRFLIGHGQSVYNSIITDFSTSYYKEIDIDRFREFIEKEDIDGITAVMRFLDEKEKTDGSSIIQRPFIFLTSHHNFFTDLENLKQMKSMISQIVLISMVTVTFSVLTLCLVDVISAYLVLKISCIVIIFFMFIWTMRMNYIGIKRGLK